MTRDLQLDALKGFAIILVIMGHVTAFSNPNNTFIGYLYGGLIYSFHMRLFFFVSGFLVFDHFGPEILTWLKKKFNQLIIPYGLFTLFSIFILFYPSAGMVSYTTAFFSYTIYGSAWFLPVLFESLVILALCILLEKFVGKYSYLGFFIIASILIPVLNFNSSSAVQQIVLYTPFVFLGYIACKYKEFLKLNIIPIEITGSAAFILLSFTQYGTTLIGNLSHLEMLYFGYIVAGAGIILSWVFVKFIIKLNLSILPVVCGIYSLELYLVHILYLNYFHDIGWPQWIGSGVVAIVTGTVFLLFLSLGTAILISLNKEISEFLFARWSYKNLKSYLKGV